MINISLTDFIDFVSRVGGSKFTKVNEVYTREPYQPAFDFWKPLREGIIDYHKSDLEKSELDKILHDLTDKNKIKLYPALIANYKSFLGRKKTEWFDPPHKLWRYGEFRMKLNPELGLEINGNLYVIKLYFKSDSLSQQKSDLILLLLNTSLKKAEYKDVNFAILDVARKKLFERTRLTEKHISLLRGEAMNFTNIWNSFEN